tara:strand:+ start:1718 stop:3103 length:1386 start_codon:yes stop_codon:yes gene_type:complete
MSKVFVYSILVLVALKIGAAFFTNFSLYGDEAQYWLWSKELDLGYYSKPPLLAWFLFGHTAFFGDSFFSLKMFPLLAYFLIFFAFYKLCLELNLSKSNSVVCSVCFLSIPAASVSSFLISTDLLLLLFWILSMIVLLRIRSAGSLKNFLLLGTFLGLAFMAKYAAIYFLLSFLILAFIDNKTLVVFKKNKISFFAFVLTLMLVVLPNLYWNFNNGWVTLSHTADNANLQNLDLNFYEPLKFLISQIFMLGVVLFFSFLYVIRFFHLDFENKFLLIFSLPIIFIVLIESFLVRANANWAAPALVSLFILMYRLVAQRDNRLIIINFATNCLVGALLFTSILVSSNLTIFDRIKGLDAFVNDMVKIVGDKDIVVSDRILFSSISYEMRNKPNNIFMPYKKGGVITNHFQMSSPLTKLHNNNFYLIGGSNDISYLINENKINLLKEFDVSFSSSNLKFYEVIFK